MIATSSARCPLCGEACDTVYTDLAHQPVGCDHCIIPVPIHDFVVGGDIIKGEYHNG